MNANSCVDNILYKLYFTYFDIAVQTRVSDVS